MGTSGAGTMNKPLVSPKAVKRARKVSYHVVMQTLLFGVGLLYIFPLVWMVATSLKAPNDYNFFPSVPQWENYANALKYIPFWNLVKNSVIITSLATIGVTVSTSLVSYSFAKLRWPGRDIIFIVLLGTMMLPSQVLQIPTYILFKNFGWLNTILPLTVPFFFNPGAFNIFLLRQFYRGVPLELSEAAKIDGCSELRSCFTIVMPLCKPIISSIAIFAFMGSWNDFMGPLIYLGDPKSATLSLGLRDFFRQSGTMWNYMMVIALISMIPTLTLFFTCQKYFVSGLTMGGVKE